MHLSRIRRLFGALTALVAVMATWVVPTQAQADVIAVSPTTTSTTGVPLFELAASSPFFNLSTLHAINEDNWVVGSLGDSAVLWRGLNFEQLPRPFGGFETMRGFGLNDHGMVVGEWRSSSGATAPFRWEDGTGTRILPSPPNLYPGGSAEARDVDEDGNILVHYQRDNTSCGTGPNIAGASAVMAPPYASTISDYTTIRTQYCQNEVSGTSVDAGTVVGNVSTRLTTEHVYDGAFSWSGGTLDPTQLLGDWVPRATDGAWTVGTMLVEGNVHAVRFDGSTLEDLGTLGGATSHAHGVNSFGWVVGRSQTASGEEHAFLWTPEDGMQDLGTLGGTYSTANDINDRGNIVGLAANGTGNRYGVIWTAGETSAPDTAPDVATITSQVATADVPFSLTPAVTDAEGDPWNLTWSGAPATATTGDSLTWTPTADDVGATYTVMVTATQTDDPSLSDSETFALSVVAGMADLEAGIAVVSGDDDGDGSVLHGARVGYVATFVNKGPQDASDAEATVWLPGDIRVDDLDGVPLGCTFSQGGQTLPSQLDCDLGTIGTDPFEGAGVSFTVTVPDTNRDPFTVQVASLTADQTDPDTSNNTASTDITVVAPAADLVASLAVVSGDDDGDGTVVHGTQVGYLATFSNAGPQDATNARAVIWLPGDVTATDLDAIPFGCTFSQGGLTLPSQLGCALGTIGTETFDWRSVSFDVTMPDTNRDPFTVQVASLTADQIDPDTTDNTATADITVVPPTAGTADLEAGIAVVSGDEDGDGTVLHGARVGYVATFVNKGLQDASNAQATVWLPGDIRVDDLGGVPLGCTFSQGGQTLPSQLDCDLGTIGTDPLDAASVFFVVTVPDTNRDPFTVQVASLTADQTDPDTSNNTARTDITVVAPAADLAASLVIASGDDDGDGTVVHGTQVGYLATFSNVGPQDATGARAVIWLPGDVTAADLGAIPFGCEFSTGGTGLPSQLGCDLGTIGTNTFDWRSVSFVVTMPDTNRDPFTVLVASFTADQVDPDTTDNTATADITVVPSDDGDGIASPIDGTFADGTFTSAALVASDDFSDQGLGGTTFGSLVDRAGLAVTVADEPGSGVRVTTSAGAADATASLCDDFPVAIAPSSDVVLTCGSLTTHVLAGAVTVTLDGSTVQVPAGATVTITELDSGWQVSAEEATTPVSVTIGTTTVHLDAGETTDVPSSNEPPTAVAGGPYLVAVDTSIVLDGSGSSDPEDAALDFWWTSATGTLIDGDTSAPEFTSSVTGIHSVELQVCDPFEACDTVEAEVVVYDPSAGFVTGGGSIDSPAGACGLAAPVDSCAPGATGRATFGFVSRYVRGKSEPTGNTSFNFTAGSLQFQSEAYEWLVVSGDDKAQFRGTGTVNGRPGYRFTVTVRDDVIDGFRIRITSETGTVYDNMTGEAETIGNTQAIAQGNIVIHAR